MSLKDISAGLTDAEQRTGTKLNIGGSSLSIRLDFASGARAAFKPHQIWPQSKPRREIAAYRIDRYLHIRGGYLDRREPFPVPFRELSLLLV